MTNITVQREPKYTERDASVRSGRCGKLTITLELSNTLLELKKLSALRVKNYLTCRYRQKKSKTVKLAVPLLKRHAFVLLHAT